MEARGDLDEAGPGPSQSRSSPAAPCSDAGITISTAITTSTPQLRRHPTPHHLRRPHPCSTAPRLYLTHTFTCSFDPVLDAKCKRSVSVYQYARRRDLHRQTHQRRAGRSLPARGRGRSAARVLHRPWRVAGPLARSWGGGARSARRGPPTPTSPRSSAASTRPPRRIWDGTGRASTSSRSTSPCRHPRT